MKKPLFKETVVILSFMLLASSLNGCGVNASAAEEATEEEDHRIEVTVANPEIRDVAIKSNFSAKVEADSTVTVIPKVAGEVTEKYFEVGDHVNEGDLLFRIDDESAKLQLDNAKATLDSASAGYTAQQATNASTKAQANETIAKISSNEAQLDLAVDNAYAQKRSAGNTFETQSESEEYYENEYYEAIDDLDDMKKDKKKLKRQRDSLESTISTYRSKESSEGAEKAMEWLKSQGFDTLTELKTAYSSASSAYESAKTAINGLENSIESYDLQKRTTGLAADSAEMGYYTAEESLAIAEQNRDIYKNFTKATTLYGVNAQVVGADASLINSEASLRQAKVGVENAEMNLDNYTVTAPVSGTITDIGVSLHNMASSATSAYTIESDSRNKIVFFVAEETVQSIKPGNDAVITKNGEDFAAKITDVGNTLDQETGLFKVEAVMNDYKTEFLNGSTVSVKTVTRETKSAVTVPMDAVYYDDEQAYVFVSEDGKAVRRDIETGISDETGIVVTKGLNKSDDIIVSWSSQLRDGAEINVTQREKAEDNSGNAGNTEKTDSTVRISDPAEITAGEASTEINPDALADDKDTEEE